MESYQKQLFLLLLSHTFWKTHSNKVSKNYFGGHLQSFYSTLEHHYAQRDTSLNVDELHALHTVLNPALTKAQLDILAFLANELKSCPAPNPEVGEEIINQLYKQEQARKIAERAVNIMNGRVEDTAFDEIRGVLDGLKEEKFFEPQLQEVSTEFEDIIKTAETPNEFTFNLSELQKVTNGFGRGHFFIAFARPETGKTGFWVSLSAAPFGWLEQGHKVLAICNEEAAARTMVRVLLSRAGMTLEDVLKYPDKARALYEPIRKNITLIDSVDMTVEKLNDIVKDKRPDIVIIDQLDKLHTAGSFSRTDERLKQIYIQARELGKRYSCGVMALCQASAEGEGRAILTQDMMENSKTGKAGEGDLIIGIGLSHANDGSQVYARTLHLCKNKISGWHGVINAIIQPTISRYVN